jgi:hypothetical protein
MLLLSTVRRLMALAILLVLASSSVVVGQMTKDVTFETYDGVELSGEFYPNPGGKREATVILLHDFKLKEGGASDKGFPELAKMLQEDGYSVLRFDFRGFGGSKTVKPTFSTKYKHNQTIKKSKANTIEASTFPSSYTAQFINDIAAARAFLDRQNDNKTCNTSSLIVIGAGNSASLGAAWMYSEGRRARDKNMLPMLVPNLSEPDSKDFAAAVWLTMTPTITGRSTSVSRFLLDAGKTNRIPMAFLYGKQDATGTKVANDFAKAIKGDSKSKDFQFTSAAAIDGTKLTGQALLDNALNEKIKKYLGEVMSERGQKEWVARKNTESRIYEVRPSLKAGGAPIVSGLIKPAGDEVAPINIEQLMMGK